MASRFGDCSRSAIHPVLSFEGYDDFEDYLGPRWHCYLGDIIATIPVPLVFVKGQFESGVAARLLKEFAADPYPYLAGIFREYSRSFGNNGKATSERIVIAGMLVWGFCRLRFHRKYSQSPGERRTNFVVGVSIVWNTIRSAPRSSIWIFDRLVAERGGGGGVAELRVRLGRNSGDPPSPRLRQDKQWRHEQANVGAECSAFAEATSTTSRVLAFGLAFNSQQAG